jgi:hypothetical protein
MKKTVLLVVVAAFAASPAAAESKQLTVKQAMEQNQKSWELVKGGLPLVLPSWALPFYFSMQQNADKTGHGAHKKK